VNGEVESDMNVLHDMNVSRDSIIDGLMTMRQ
jgi:hypothetical protein